MQRAYVHNSGGVRESLQLPAPREVALQPASPERLIALLDPAQVAAVTAAMSRAPMALGGRTTINVNSTAAGGGVAEMLGSLLPYTLGAGVDTRWLVIDGDREFFAAGRWYTLSLYPSRGWEKRKWRKRLPKRIANSNHISESAAIRSGRSPRFRAR